MQTSGGKIITPRALVFDLAGRAARLRRRRVASHLSNGRVSAEEFGRFCVTISVGQRVVLRPLLAEPSQRGRRRDLARGDPESSCRVPGVAAWACTLGAFELLGELRPHYQLACLSNTNALDVQRFRDELRLDDVFYRCFFSHEIGLRKPEPTAIVASWKASPCARRRSCSSTRAANASTAREAWAFERIKRSAWMKCAPHFDV